MDLSANSLVITPRLGSSNGSVSLYEPASGTRLSYNYTVLQNSTVLFDYETTYPGEIKFNFCVPENKRLTYTRTPLLKVLTIIMKMGDSLLLVVRVTGQFIKLCTTEI